MNLLRRLIYHIKKRTHIIGRNNKMIGYVDNTELETKIKKIKEEH